MDLLSSQFKFFLVLVPNLFPTSLVAFSTHAADMQESEVSAVKYIKWIEYEELQRKKDASFVPCDVDGGYSALFSAIRSR